MIGEALRPVTEDEVATYQRDGAVLLQGIMPPEWVELVQEGVEEAVAGEPSPLRGEVAEDGGRTVNVQMAATLSDKLWRYVFESPAAAIAGAVHQATQLQFHLDQIFYKHAGPVRITDWHQDTPYLDVSGRDLVRVWLPLDPSPRQLTVQVVRGSHRWNVTYQINVPANAAEIFKVAGDEGFDFREWVDPDLQPLPDILGQPESFDIIGWDVEPGDVIVFNGHILHGAGGSPSHPLLRRAFAVLYAGPEERYVARASRPVHNIASVRGLELADGARLCDHPDVYPLVWTASGGLQ